MDDLNPAPRGNKTYQINSADLVELERIIPALHEAVALGTGITNRTRAQLRRCKKILSDVRWEYGPWEEVESSDEQA